MDLTRRHGRLVRRRCPRASSRRSCSTSSSSARRPSRRSPEFLAALKKRGVEDVSLVMVDPWSAGIYGTERPRTRAGACRGPCAGSAPSRRTTATPGRSTASSPSSISTRWRCSGSRITASCRCRPRPATGPASTSARPAHGPQAAGDRPAGRAQLPRRRPRGPLAELAVPHRLQRRAKGWCCTRSRYNDGGAERPILLPGLGRARWSCPTATRRAVFPQERLRHRRVRHRHAGQLAVAGLRLPGRDPLLRRPHDQQPGRAVTIKNAVCLHEEDVGILWKHTDWRTNQTRGAPLAPAGRSRSSPPSATTSTASSGTSTRTARSSARSS